MKCYIYVMLHSSFIYLLFHPHGTVNDMNVCLITVLSVFCNFIFSCSVCDIKM